MVTPTPFNRRKIWFICHILRMDTPKLMQAAIYLSPLYPEISEIFYKKHDVCCRIRFMEMSRRSCDLELTLEEA